VRKALHLEREMSPVERTLRKSLRSQGASIPAIRRPSDTWLAWRNRALRSRTEVAAALAEIAACGLPAHPGQPKNWDLLVALGSILQATRRADRVLEMGATQYTKLLPWLYLYGYRSLVGIDLVTKQDVVDGPIQSLKMDLTKTTFSSGSFAAIACLSVVEHGVSLEAYLAEARRLLRPGGVLITSTDFWCSQLDTQGAEAYGVPVRIFMPDEIRAFDDRARTMGFHRQGSLELTCDDPVVNWERTSLRYTFVNLVHNRPDDWRARARAPLRVLSALDPRWP
jgi:SAM-dependent methyltransferase